MKLFYDCTRSSKALRTGVHSLSLLYRLVKVGLSDEVRAQALVLRLHCSFLCERIPRHVGPFHRASYSFHYRGLSGPVESRFGSLGAQAPANPTLSETENFGKPIHRSTHHHLVLHPWPCATVLICCLSVISLFLSSFSVLIVIPYSLVSMHASYAVRSVDGPTPTNFQIWSRLPLSSDLSIDSRRRAPRECVPFVLISYVLSWLTHVAQTYMLR